MTFDEIDARYRAAVLTPAAGSEEWDDPEIEDADEDDEPGYRHADEDATHDESSEPGDQE